MLHSLSAPLWWWWICHLAGTAWKSGAEIHVELISWRADQSRGLSIGLGGSWDGFCLGYADRLLWSRYLTSVFFAFSCKRRLISLLVDVGVFSASGLCNDILIATKKVLVDSVKVCKTACTCVGLHITNALPPKCLHLTHTLHKILVYTTLCSIEQCWVSCYFLTNKEAISPWQGRLDRGELMQTFSISTTLW